MSTPQTSVRSREVLVGEARVHLLEAGPIDGSPVVLLHGAAFQAETWRELGTIELLARNGFRTLAVDLPGWRGKSPAADHDRNAFLGQLLDALQLDVPAILSPSMSGGYALPLLIADPDRISSWIAVAPAGLPPALDRLKDLKLPVLILWGANDRTFPVSLADELESVLLDGSKLILPDAGHACYLDATEAFHARLIDFLNQTAAH